MIYIISRDVLCWLIVIHELIIMVIDETTVAEKVFQCIEIFLYLHILKMETMIKNQVSINSRMNMEKIFLFFIFLGRGLKQIYRSVTFLINHS